MSELIATGGERTGLRWRLLATTSAIVLLGLRYGADDALAADNERPTVWIELGGQLSRLNDGREVFSPPLMAMRPSNFDPSAKFETPPHHSIAETGKISLRPDSLDWVFAVSARYGRTSSNRDVRQQTKPEPYVRTASGIPTYKIAPRAARFVDTNARDTEQHLILDFTVGKDVGLGAFGIKDGESTINFGVRFAQFSARSNIALKSNPDWRFSYQYFNFPSLGITNFKFPTGQPYHSNAAAIHVERSFHGLGPSLSWNGSVPFAGNPQDSELSFDWGANVAMLFGRQRSAAQHHATEQYHSPGIYNNLCVGDCRHVVYQHSSDPKRSRSVVVPNVGGFAGVSFRYDSAKVSFGYRADFFFGAMDGGIDSRKTYDRNFYGPFATVSIGLGG